MNTKKDFFSLTVKAAIINKEGKILIIKRSKDDAIKAGEYDLPGGNVDCRENIEVAMKREIKEELGIEVKLGQIIYAFDFENKYDREYEFGKEKIKVGGKGLRFIAYYEDGDIELSHEHQKFEWLDFDKALEKFGDSDFTKDKKETIRRAKEYLEMKNSLEGWKRCMADFENYKKRQNEEKKDLIAFLENWTSHGQHLEASFVTKYNRFIIIAVNQEVQPATGCSIDASVQFIQNLEQKYGVDLLDKMNVTFKMGEHVAFKPLIEFKKLAKEKAV